MRLIKIGIYDKEREYVEKLCSFLQEYGKGKWRLSGYTDKELLIKALQSGKFDLLISPDMETLMQFEKEDITFLFLSEETTKMKEGETINYVYRYQSAKEIAENVHELVTKKRKQKIEEKMIIGIYSPVAGCGKTRLACDIISRRDYGNYLYFGMEDYCSFEIYSDTGEVLYYIKERRAENLLKVIRNSEDKVILGQGAFENRLLEKEDFIWLKSVLKDSVYDGFIFDIGTGSIKDLTLLYEFDYMLIPFLHGNYSDYKIENFQKIIKLYDLEELQEKCIFLDMDWKEDVEEKIKEILCMK